MNTVTKVAVLLVSMATVFSFSEDTPPADSSQLKVKPFVYVTVPVCRVASGCVTIDSLKRSQTSYSNLFYGFMGGVSAIIAVLVFFNMKFAKKLNSNVKRILNEQQTLFEKKHERLNADIKGSNNEIHSRIKGDIDTALNAHKADIKEFLEKNNNAIHSRIKGDIDTALNAHKNEIKTALDGIRAALPNPNMAEPETFEPEDTSGTSQERPVGKKGLAL